MRLIPWRRSTSQLEDKVEERVREIIVNELGVASAEVTSEAKFIDDLGADSMGIVELVLAFEKEFDIEIPEEDAEKLTTFGDAVEYLKKRGVVVTIYTSSTTYA